MPRSRFRTRRKYLCYPSRSSRRKRYGKRKRYVRFRRRRARRRKYRAPPGKRSARGLRVHRTRRTLPRVSYPIVPVPPRKALTLVWRDTLPLRIDDFDHPLIINLNNIHCPINKLSNDYILAGSDWPPTNPDGSQAFPQLQPIVGGYNEHQPYNHDLMCSLYKNCCVISCEVSVKPIPQTNIVEPNILPVAADTSAMQDQWGTVTNLQCPYRAVITMDPTTDQNLIRDLDAYREQQFRLKFNGLTGRTGGMTVSNIGSQTIPTVGSNLTQTKVTRPIRCHYDVRRFWNIPKYQLTFRGNDNPLYRLQQSSMYPSYGEGHDHGDVISFATGALGVHLHQWGIPPYGAGSNTTTAAVPNANVNIQGATQSDAVAVLVKPAASCPWQQQTDCTAPNGSPFAAAYARVQLLSEHHGNIPIENVKLCAPILHRVVIKYKVVFFDRSELSMPHEVDKDDECCETLDDDAGVEQGQAAEEDDHLHDDPGHDE